MTVPHEEWIGIPVHDGWIVRVVLRPALDVPLIDYDCICKIYVRKGEPVRMQIPLGVRAVVLTLCVDGEHELEHAPLPMTLANPSEPVN